jgi:rSAM/selenodomain-associated transferase 1
MIDRQALIIIAKRPEKGKVKTRLNGHMPADAVVKLYTHLLDQTVQKLRTIPGVDTHIAFAPEESIDYFSRFGVNLIPLHKGDLGIRMSEAFEELFSRGYRKAVLVGADIPDLSSGIIMNAFDVLSVNDLVFGPAQDGGYYLVGMSKFTKEIFENVPWSTNKTLIKSLDQAKRFRLTAGFTDTLSDIDKIEDVERAGLLNI